MKITNQNEYAEAIIKLNRLWNYPENTPEAEVKATIIDACIEYEDRIDYYGQKAQPLTTAEMWIFAGLVLTALLGCFSIILSICFYMAGVAFGTENAELYAVVAFSVSALHAVPFFYLLGILKDERRAKFIEWFNGMYDNGFITRN